MPRRLSILSRVGLSRATSASDHEVPADESRSDLSKAKSRRSRGRTRSARRTKLPAEPPPTSTTAHARRCRQRNPPTMQKSRRPAGCGDRSAASKRALHAAGSPRPSPCARCGNPVVRLEVHDRKIELVHVAGRKPQPIARLPADGSARQRTPILANNLG